MVAVRTASVGRWWSKTNEIGWNNFNELLLYVMILPNLSKDVPALLTEAKR